MNLLKNGCCATALLLLLGVGRGAAESPDPVTVEVTIVAIYAHNRNEQVDPRLKKLAEKIHNAVPQLTGFTLGKTMRQSVSVGSKTRFALVDDQVALMTILQAAKKENLIQLKLTPPQMSEVTYETSTSRYLPIITKYTTKNKDVLILAISVKPSEK